MSKPKGWEKESLRHSEAKRYGRASPSTKAKPKYTRKKKNPLDRSLSYVRGILTRRRKGAIGYFYQDQYISLEEGDALVEKTMKGVVSAWKDSRYRGHGSQGWTILLVKPRSDKEEDGNDQIDIADDNEFPIPVKVNPIQYRPIDEVVGHKIDWAMTDESAEAIRKNLEKYIGKEVHLTGGGGGGDSTCILKSVEIEDTLFSKKPENVGKKSIRVHLKNIRGYGCFGEEIEQEERDPWLGSWRLSVAEPMPMTKYVPPKEV